MSILHPILAAARRLVRRPAAESRPLAVRLTASPAETRWLFPSVSSATPQRVEWLLRGALAGDPQGQWELWDLMEDTWPRLAKCLNEIKRAVARMDWTVTPWSEQGQDPTPEAEERARLVSAALWQMRPAAARGENAFEGTVYDLLDAWGKGVSVVEVDWQERDGVWLPRATAWVPPRAYGWHPDGWLGLRPSGRITPGAPAGADLEPFPEHKFLVALARAKSGHPGASALLRPLAWWWCVATLGAEWLLDHAQLFGQPLRWATYDPQRKELLPQISDMMANLGRSGWAVFPAGTQIELREAQKAGGNDPQAYLLGLAEKACDLLILGQTLTTDVADSGSRALGAVHADVRGDIILAAADFVAGVINRQLIPSVLDLNYGVADYAPEVRGTPRRQDDPLALAQRDAILLSAGVPLPRVWLYERHGVPLPGDAEETILGKTSDGVPAMPSVAGSTSRTTPVQAAVGRRAANAPEEGVAELVRQAVAESVGVRTRWLEPLAQELDRLIAAVRDGRLTDEELREFLDSARRNLPDLFAQLDQGALADHLEAYLGASALRGLRARL